jgi:hypothetical protein
VFKCQYMCRSVQDRYVGVFIATELSHSSVSLDSAPSSVQCGNYLSESSVEIGVVIFFIH